MSALFDLVYTPAYIKAANAKGRRFKDLADLGSSLVQSAMEKRHRKGKQTKKASELTIEEIQAELLPQTKIAIVAPLVGAGIGAISGAIADPHPVHGQAHTVKRHATIGAKTGVGVSLGTLLGGAAGGGMGYLADRFLDDDKDERRIGTRVGAGLGALLGGIIAYRMATAKKRRKAQE